MSYQTIQFSIVRGIARLLLNRPENMNSITASMRADLRAAFTQVSPEVARVLVISGAGRAFCTGQDLSERFRNEGEPKVYLGASIDKNYAPLLRALRALPLLVIAADNGIAAGAGCNLALACDLVVAARSATFIQSFCKLGLMPDAGGTWSLPRAIGTAPALGLTFLGEAISAKEAERWGMIWRCVDDVAFPAAVEELSEKLARSSSKAIAGTKQAIYAGATRSFDAALDAERDGQRELGFSADYTAGLNAFMEKRAPVFAGAKKGEACDIR